MITPVLIPAVFSDSFKRKAKTLDGCVNVTERAEHCLEGKFSRIERAEFSGPVVIYVHNRKRQKQLDLMLTITVRRP